MFITSDLHFMHKRIREFAPEYRPWEDMEHMTEALIAAWNERAITPGVKMYHLGDFCFGTEEDTRKIASRLQGDITFLVGNHDHSKHRKILAEYGEVEYYVEVKYNKEFIVLSHYPFLDWNRKRHGSIHLHGHEHGNLVATEESRGKTMDVGWDVHGRFLHFDEIIKMMAKREVNGVGHHK